ncbi:MAG TPA: chemotaxis protein CheW [Blastocatellia bacterium]|nr:chemotaxis protein CheW [Blastocatellia bacterium]
MSAIAAAHSQSQYFTFFMAGEEYAIGILKVKEIIVYSELTRVPKTPPYVRGVINLRGSVVPVVDLAVKFGLPESPITNLTCIIIVEVDVEGEETVMGVIADSVNQVVDLMPDDIQPSPAFGTRVRVDYLLGMGKSGEKFVLILDIDKVLASGELQPVTSLQGAVPDKRSRMNNDRQQDIAEDA